MVIFQKLRSEKIKFELDITVHFVSTRLKNQGKLQVAAFRGNDKRGETQAMPYDFAQQRSIFEYPINFSTTLYRRGGKFLQKFITFKLYGFELNKKSKQGKARIDISEAATYGITIMKVELPLRQCIDKSANLYVTITMNSAKTISNQKLPNPLPSISTNPNTDSDSSDLSKVNAVDESKFVNNSVPIRKNSVESSSVIKEKSEKDDLLFDKKYDTSQGLVLKHTHNEDKLMKASAEENSYTPSRADRVSHTDIFVGLGISKEDFINPKDSLVESEESSSEEDLIDVSSDLEHPKTETPYNETKDKSQESDLADKEEIR